MKITTDKLDLDRQWVIDSLMQAYWAKDHLTPEKIALRLGQRGDSVRKALTILRRQNKVVRAEDGTYSLLTPPAPAQSETVNP